MRPCRDSIKQVYMGMCLAKQKLFQCSLAEGWAYKGWSQCLGSCSLLSTCGVQAACSTSLPPCTRRVGALTTNPPLLNKVWFHAEVRDLLKVRLPGCKTATLEWKYPRYTAHSTVTGGQRMLKIPATHGGVRLPRGRLAKVVDSEGHWVAASPVIIHCPGMPFSSRCILWP